VEKIGDIDPVEAWWVERQEALERAGYIAPTSLPPWLETLPGLVPTNSTLAVKMVSFNG